MRVLLSILVLALLVLSTNSLAGFQGFEGTTSLGIFGKITCGDNITCTRAGKNRDRINLAGSVNLTSDGTGSIYGYVNEVANSATATLTGADCGKSFVSTATSILTLPRASTVLGCRISFYSGTNAAGPGATSVLTITPYAGVYPIDADQILIVTDATANSIQNEVLGNSIHLEAIQSGDWTPSSSPVGTWYDVN